VTNALEVARLVPWLIAFGVLKHVVSLPRLVRLAARRNVKGPPLGDPRHIAAVVLRAGAIAGAPRRDCLQRSLLLFRELAASGFQPELLVGFRRSGDALSGHAWVTLGDRPVAEPELDTAVVVSLMRFRSDGAIVR
jgi:hypothetical protein